ncbi:MAG: Slp family lipoprotein, partial [Acidimicrobiia bacterium]
MQTSSLACAPLIASSLLLGCVELPPALEKGPFAEITPKSAGDDMLGQRVRWGGQITTSRISEQESCFEVLAVELDVKARPRWDNTSQGSFFVCLPGFYDSAIYESGRVITVTGTVRAIESQKAADRSELLP